MRDKVIAVSAVAIAGVAVAVGLTIGALGGAFADTTTTVQPPALRSDLSSAARAAPSAGVLVPPSPTWEVAVPTTPKPTTTTTTPPETTPSGATTAKATPGAGTTESSSTRAPRRRTSDQQPATSSKVTTPTR
ncbi:MULTISPECIES: hypothetical protein [unclassified Rhodococcus (in: high G+C Gram-positive bacteria)]|uniref:hypothetical protein n=1 Tax=unclassified Rhodococcus (in: high G+C Gram-positive bacteria) TaxID=192944 RepID=UPI001FFB74AE|nr:MULTISPECIES: hypothetical protein [unclassified Rhodococcus (in: high G+C Gram-positive bacteria)]